MLEPDCVHATDLKDELAEIIIVHGLLFKTDLKLSTWMYPI